MIISALFSRHTHTTHNSIKLPQHIPLLILRDPPGGLSTVAVTKDSTVNMEWSLSMGDHHGVHVGATAGTKFFFNFEF